MAGGEIPQSCGHDFLAKKDIGQQAEHQRQRTVAQVGQQKSGGKETAADQKGTGGFFAVRMVMVVMVLVMVAAAAFMAVVLVMVTAAALVVVVLVVMTAAAVVVMVLVVVTAAALVVMVLVVMTAAAFMVMVFMTAAVVFAAVGMVTVGCLAGADDGIMLHGTGDFCQFRNQCIGIFSGEPKLTGGEGDHSFFNLGMGVEFGFNLGGAVGAV
jgi:hypothetical protein